MTTPTAPSQARCRIPLLLVLLSCAAAGCRKPAEPSAEYAQAHERFRRLYAQKLDEAFVDPEMQRVEALLAEVPPTSRDAEPARALQARISEGRQRAEAARQSQEQALAEASRPLALPAGGAPATSPPASPPTEPEAAPAPPDAGVGGDGGVAGSGPGPGTPESEVAHGFRGCFHKGTDINVRGRGLRASYTMVDRLACRLEYPALVGQVLIVEASKVLAVVPATSLRTVPADGSQSDAGR